MGTYLITIGLIFLIMLCGIVVERLYRLFAANNPQLGPFRNERGCGSCSGGKGCSSSGRCAPE